MQLSLAHHSRRYQYPRTPRRTGQSLAYTGYIQRKRNSSLAKPTGFYLSESGEPKSHTTERPFTVASLAALNLTGWGLCTYRIPAGGTEGCLMTFTMTAGHAISVDH